MDPIVALIALLQTVPVLGPVLPYIPLICGLAAIVDVAIPAPPEGHWSVGLRKLIHLLALNFGNARNAVPAGAVAAPVARLAAQTRAAAAQVEQAAGVLAEAVEGKPEASAPRARR